MSSNVLLEHREAGIDLKRQAVLLRAGHHSGQLEVELARRATPFVKYGGLKFIEAAHVKDMLSVLRDHGRAGAARRVPASSRQCFCASGRSRSAGANCRELSDAQRLSDRADPGSTRPPVPTRVRRISMKTTSCCRLYIRQRGRNGMLFPCSTSRTAAYDRTWRSATRSGSSKNAVSFMSP